MAIFPDVGQDFMDILYLNITVQMFRNPDILIGENDLTSLSYRMTISVDFFILVKT